MKREPARSKPPGPSVPLLPGPGWFLALVVFLSCHAQAPGGRNFSGMWDTFFGYMHLVQRGNEVEGKYHSDLGRLKGTVKGDTLFFSWRDHQGEGDGFFVMSEDGKSLTGAYRFRGHRDWDGPWNGVRLSR